MFLLQVAQAPVIVRIGDLELEIPKYRLKDMIVLGARVSGEMVDKATEDMDEVRKREYLSLYPPIPPGLGMMKDIARSLVGAEDVIRTCLPRAKAFKITGTPKTIRRKVKGSPKDKPKYEEATITEYERTVEVTKEEFKKQVPKILEMILEANGSGSIVYLGYELADLEDKSAVRPPEFKVVEDDEDKDVDPLLSEGQESSAT